MALHTGRHWASFLIGVIVFLLGLFPLIGEETWLGPLNSVVGTVAMYVIAFGGAFMIFDGFCEITFHSGVFIISFIAGLAVFGLGLVTILHLMGAIAFGFYFLTPIVYNILFMLEGLFLMLGAFVMD